MKKAKKVTTDGLEIIDQELYLGKPDRQAQLERAGATPQWHARFTIRAPKPD